MSVTEPMRKITIIFIDLYQRVLSYFLKNILGVSSFCRFRPTCSEYTKTAIKEKGFMKGAYIGFVRILKCQPLYKGV